MSNPDPTAEAPIDVDRDAPTDADEVAVPEYESDQYLPQQGVVTSVRRRHLREEFGYVRTYFKLRPERHYNLQRRLNQGRFGTTFDLYLTRSVWYALGAGLIASVIGLTIAYLVIQAGAFDDATAPFAVPTEGVAGSVVAAIGDNASLIGASAIVVTLTGVTGGLTWYGRYLYPFIRVDSRRRNIDITMPHVIVYMYALSYGGMGLVEIISRTADTQDIYGEVANEFDLIVTDMEVFGNDLFTALRNARNLTPSDNMERFLDDMISVLDSGGDLTEFLHGESRKYMEEATREQESFLDTLEALSEIFVVMFVAAPLFIIVMLLVMSFLGSDTIPVLYVTIYAALPLGMAAFLVLISILSEPYKQPDHQLEIDEDGPEPSPALEDFAGFQTFEAIRRRDRIARFLQDPVRVFKRQPLYSLGLTVPVTVAYLIGVWFTVDLSLSAFHNDVYLTTTAAVVVPFLLVTMPLAAFYEVERRRRKSITQRLPDMLDILASSNQMGVSFVDGLGMVSRNLSGRFADELNRLQNDIKWNGDVQGSLTSMAHRLEVPQLTRTSYILAEGSRASGELFRLLSVAAEDTRQRYRLERNRVQNLQAYTMIVVIGFLVYLTVVVILDLSFIGAIEEVLADTDPDDLGPITIDLDDLATYNMLFLHSALIMAVGTGLISGKLTDNSILSGLKYSIGLVSLTMLVFLFLLVFM